MHVLLCGPAATDRIVVSYVRRMKLLSKQKVAALEEEE